MYQFEDNYRYSIYSLDGTFGGLEDAGGSPNPYTISEDIITINLFFGNIVSYKMNYLCEGEIVELIYTENNIIHSTLFREGFDYANSFCNGCNIGYIEIDGLCYYENDINILQNLIDNSYSSGIDLGCDDGDPYCGSPNPFMDTGSDLVFDGIYINSLNSINNGIVEPLELGYQGWVDGRLVSLMCGAYIYCSLSGELPENISNLTEIEVLRLELNYFSGDIPQSVCEFENINYNDNLSFDFSYNQLCPPYPDCISDGAVGYMDTSECSLNGDLNNDYNVDVVDVIILVNHILSPATVELDGADVNNDQEINIQDVVLLVNIILT